MINEGWIKIHRKILDWEWWSEMGTFKLFVYLLLKANHETKTWKGITVKRGELITGRKQLAKACHLSEQTIRTSLKRLKSTNEITIKSTNQFSLIKINSYEDYQQVNQPANQQVTSKQPATNHKQEYKNDKNDKNIISKDIKDITAKAEYGNKDINLILLALKKTIGIDAFVDSKFERMFGKHCLNLIEKIGKEEFKSRLSALLSDSFHSKNCNKIKYVYNNIKGFKTPNLQTKVAEL